MKNLVKLDQLLKHFNKLKRFGTELDDHVQSLEYVKEALHLSKKLFGHADQSVKLAGIYINAGAVYEHCNLNDEALFWYQRCLKLLKLVLGDIPHPGKTTKK